jgi:hypothetical protein
MVDRWAAWALVLALSTFASGSAAAQSPGTPPPRGHKLGTLGQNYPNPFRPDTYIPFTIDDCGDPGGQRVVSLRVYNVLAQLVATPMLHGADKPLASMRLSCGEYTAHWDGRQSKSRRPAPAGVYVYELVIDGERTSRKMFVSK